MDRSLCALQGCQNPVPVLTSSHGELWMFHNLCMVHLSFSSVTVWIIDPRSSISIVANCQQLFWWATSWLNGLSFRVSIKIPVQHLLSRCLIPKCMWNTQYRQGEEREGKKWRDFIVSNGKYQYLNLADKFILTLMCVWEYVGKTIWEGKYRWVKKEGRNVAGDRKLEEEN